MLLIRQAFGKINLPEINRVDYQHNFAFIQNLYDVIYIYFDGRHLSAQDVAMIFTLEEINLINFLLNESTPDDIKALPTSFPVRYSFPPPGGTLGQSITRSLDVEDLSDHFEFLTFW